MIIQSSDTEKLKNDVAYQNFLLENPGNGFLKIRTSSANEALPVSDVQIIVSKKIGNNTIIFFEGTTDDSGMINNIKLPTPVKVKSDEDIPKFTTYNLKASYPPTLFDKTYEIALCCGVSVIQYINITPDANYEMRYKNGY